MILPSVPDAISRLPAHAPSRRTLSRTLAHSETPRPNGHDRERGSTRTPAPPPQVDRTRARRVGGSTKTMLVSSLCARIRYDCFVHDLSPAQPPEPALRRL